MSGSDSISPTAHYTGYVWARNGLSHPELVTAEGRLMFESLRPAISTGRVFGGVSLESYLLTRHRAIDALLTRAIEERGVTQVIEVACGLSPRGWRFSQRFGDRLTYVETDLPAMAARKRDALTRMGSLNRHHRVEDVDALRDDGADSLAAVAGKLDPGEGLAIITEGLLGYLPWAAVAAMWHRFATVLGGFQTGIYISELHMSGIQSAQVRAFRLALAAFVRGRVYLHFERPEQAEAALREAGFAEARLQPATRIEPHGRGPGSGRVHILEASTK